MINIRLTYLVELRIISLSVLFHDRTSSFYFLRKLLEFRAFTNSLDHLDCSLGALAVFMIKIFISGIKFLSQSINAVVRTCACAIALDRFDLKIVYVWLTYLVKIRMNLLSVLFWEGSLSSYFLRKLFKFGAYTNSLDHLDCSLAVFHNSLFQEGNFLFLFPSTKAVVGTCSCAIYLDHLDFLWLIFGSHI